MKREGGRWISLVALLIAGCAATSFAGACSRPAPSSDANTEKTDSALAHFWDTVDFTDTVMARDHLAMEKKVSEFLTLFPQATDEGRKTGVKKLLSAAEKDSTAYVMLRNITEDILYDPDAPLYSQEYYNLFLEQYVNSPILDQYAVARAEAQLESVSKNLPGTPAPDFSFITREGENATLLESISKEGETLLMFFDPSCDHCTELIETLAGNDNLRNAATAGQAAVIAIYSGADETEWERKAAEMPAEWTVGIEPETIEENELYEFRAMPTLYLLNPDGTVRIKDLSSSLLNTYLETL